MADHYDTQDSVNGTLVNSDLQLLASEKMVRITLTGTYTGVTGKIQGSHDGTNYVDISGMREDTGGMVTGTVTVGASNVSIISNVAGWRNVRWKPTAVASGTSTARITGGSDFKLPLGATAITVASIASTITSSSANALAVGANGTTAPVLKVDASASSVATGISVTGAAAASGVAIAAISSGTDESLAIDAKGSGEIGLNATGTGDIVMNRATRFPDAIDAMFGTGEDAKLRWSTADSDNHSFVIGLDNTNQSLHITDVGAIATDWNISATTDPNLYLHSNTTPATDYLRLGNHTGTVADIDVVGGTTLQLQIGGTSEVTMTATQLNVLDANNLVVGGSTLYTVGGTVPTFQVVGTTTAVDGSALFATASTTNSSETEIKILKVGNASLGSFTTVAQSENLGSIAWYGDDGTDYATVAARIRAVVNASGTVATSRVPTDIVFSTDPGGADDAIAEIARFGCGGILFIGDTTDANLTKGLCINQGGSDDGILSLKSSDVAHGITDEAETDTYGFVKKFAAADGGLKIVGFSDATVAVEICGFGATADATDAPTTTSTASITLNGGKKSGTAAAALAATENLLNVENVGTAEFVVKGDGELYSNQSATVGTFDDHDDSAMCAALSYHLSAQFADKAMCEEYQRILDYDRPLLNKLGILSDDPEGGKGMYSLTKMNMLAICAVGQLGRQINTLAAHLGLQLAPNGGIRPALAG